MLSYYICHIPIELLSGSGRNTIKYLSRYVFKVAISDHRIIKIHNRRVYFKYTNRETSKVSIISFFSVISWIIVKHKRNETTRFMEFRYPKTPFKNNISLAIPHILIYFLISLQEQWIEIDVKGLG